MIGGNAYHNISVIGYFFFFFTYVLPHTLVSQDNNVNIGDSFIPRFPT